MKIAIAVTTIVGAMLMPAIAARADNNSGSGQPEPGSAANNLSIGPEFGYYFPTAAKTRDAFGKSWFSVGIGLGDVSESSRDRRVTFDLNILAASRGSDQAIVVPIGASYSAALSPGNRGLIPYAGAAVDVAGAYLSAPGVGLHAQTTFTGCASVFTGVSFGSVAYVQARFNAFAATRGYDLSGLDLTLGVRF